MILLQPKTFQDYLPHEWSHCLDVCIMWGFLLKYEDDNKGKYRNRFTVGHLENCTRMAMTNYSPNIYKSVDESKSHPFQCSIFVIVLL